MAVPNFLEISLLKLIPKTPGFESHGTKTWRLLKNYLLDRIYDIPQEVTAQAGTDQDSPGGAKIGSGNEARNDPFHFLSYQQNRALVEQELGNPQYCTTVDPASVSH